MLSSCFFLNWFPVPLAPLNSNYIFYCADTITRLPLSLAHQVKNVSSILPSKALRLEADTVVHDFNPSTQDTEAGGSL